MNARWLVARAGLAACAVFAGPLTKVAAVEPLATVADTVYTEVMFAGSTVSLTLYHLRADGVARKLFGRGYGPATQYQYVYTASEQFTYTYAIDSVSPSGEATLAFSGGATTPDFSRRLYFSSEDSKGGQLGSPSTTSSFRFATRTTRAGALNVSNRLWLHPGETNVTGFILERPQWVLVRGVGPSLAKMGVPVVVSDPAIRLFAGSTVLTENDQWGVNGPDAQGMTWIFELVGAFPYDPGAADAAVFFNLDHGPHTVHATADQATPGEVLVEAYVIPYD